MTDADMNDERSTGPLLTADALAKSKVRPRSRFGFLFGVTSKDLKAAEQRLMKQVARPAPVRTEEGQTAPLSKDTGYTGRIARTAAGITDRQLDYWARTGLVEPTVRGVTGPGTQRLYTFRDILLLKVIKRLLDAGISLQQIRTAVHHLRERGTDDLTRVTLMSDGASVYECTSNDEVIDLLQGGQGVFGIAIGGVWREIEDSLGEMARSGEAPTPESANSAEDQDLIVPAAGSDAFLDELQALTASLREMSREQQARVSALVRDLHLMDGLREMPEVVDLESVRASKQAEAESVSDQRRRTWS